jgi:hypothetical protein
MAQQNRTLDFPRWVKPGKAQCTQMFSALPLEADMAQCSRHVCFVPTPDVSRVAELIRLNEIADRNNSIQENLGPHAAPIEISLCKSRLASNCGRDVAWPGWLGAA